MDPSLYVGDSFSSSSPMLLRQQNYLSRETASPTNLTEPALATPTRKQSIFDNTLGLPNTAAPLSNSSAGGSEFTKRKTWSQRIINELQDFLHVLSPTAKIMFCSPSSLELVGYTPEELVGRNITEFIHVDDIDMFMREFQIAIHTRRELKLYYRFRKKDDKLIVFEVTGHPYFTENSAVSKCFFAMAQPYSSKATAMLDSFLELKFENERLRNKLHELRLARQAEKDSDKDGAGSDTTTNSSAGTVNPFDVATTTEDTPMDLSDGPSFFDTRNVSAGTLVYPAVVNRATSESIELFTGLHYSDGERSSGISTGATDASLLDGRARKPTVSDIEAGATSDPMTIVGGNHTQRSASPPPSSSTDDAKKIPRRKKPKMDEEEYICTDCGTTESPEWRKGPMGPKTLCNACGLRWAKKNKKKDPGASVNGGGGGGGEAGDGGGDGDM